MITTDKILKYLILLSITILQPCYLLHAQEIKKPNEFYLGQRANAKQINENFDALYHILNQTNTDKNLWLYELAKSNGFSNNQTANSAQINQNFDELFSYLNIIHRLYERPMVQELYSFNSGQIAYPAQINSNFDELYLAANNLSNLPLLPVLPFKLPDTGQTISFSSTFGEDHDYAYNSSFLVDFQNQTIKDLNTGLFWQKENDDVYRNSYDAENYCGRLTLGGFDDWRLPNMKELHSIVHYGASKPAIKSDYFPNTNSSSSNSSRYWSSEWDMADLFEPDFFRWSVSFYYGHSVLESELTGSNLVRCVRGRSDSGGWSKGYSELGNDTISDDGTGLIWQKEVDPISKNWEGAIEYCENLLLGNKSDWRLPNIKELHSIVNFTNNEEFFPDNVYASHWSSTTFENFSDSAWNVELPDNLGIYEGLLVKNALKTETHRVRCVRGQPNVSQ